jgi:nucleoside-diphosphate-sugar epimerase
MNRSPHRARVGVTGVTGFVGRRLAMRLLADGGEVVGIGRRRRDRREDRRELPLEIMDVGGIDGDTDWGESLANVGTVVHLAGRTHAVRDRGRENLSEYRGVNVDGTRSLAEAAGRAGVRRFVFVSSIKVNGERTSNRPFMAGDPPAPEDAYGISKWEAEQAVAEVAARVGFEAVVVRPPLVYGPGATGNFARLCRAVRRGYVLPLGAVDNRRSWIALDNLVDVIVRCVDHPSAPDQIFLVADGEDLSTPEWIRRIALSMRVRARLLAVPPRVLRTAGLLIGRNAEIDRLLGSLQVDIGYTRRILGWVPPLTVEQGLQAAVQGA